MSNSRDQWLIIALVIAVVVLAWIAGLFVWQLGWLKVQVAFAEDQTEIFDAMREKALAADDPTTAAGCLDYAVNYYPSGSKQEAGSRLDTIVERQRAHIIKDIIVDLRKKTGQDLGNDPQTWIEKYAHR